MKYRDKLIKYCQERWQSYLSAPQLLSDWKIKSVYEKLLRNQSVVSVLKTGHQLFQTFSICILSWLLHVLYVFIFPSMYGYNLMPPSPLGWWNGQLLGNEMWVPVLQLHQGASYSSLCSLWLNCCLVGQTTQRQVQETETQVLSLQIFEYFSYRPPAKHKRGIFVWKTVGSSWLCITWKPCLEEKLCSAGVDPPAAVLHITAGRLYLATWFGSHKFLDCSTSYQARSASP